MCVCVSGRENARVGVLLSVGVCAGACVLCRKDAPLDWSNGKATRRHKVLLSPGERLLPAVVPERQWSLEKVAELHKKPGGHRGVCSHFLSGSCSGETEDV